MTWTPTPRRTLAVLITASMVAAAPATVGFTGSAAATPAPTSSADVDLSAVEQAERTGEPVPVPADTTEYSTTTAEPDGDLLASFSAVPQHVEVDGTWKPIDTSLDWQPDGTLAPRQTVSTPALSGGGTTPLASMYSALGSVALSWPTALPTPTANGDTATYPDVLDGVDLQVRANPDGGISEVLVVKTPSAADDAGLDAVKIAVAAHGVSLSQDAAGNITAATGDGQSAFHAPSPIMWDSGHDSTTATAAAGEHGPSTDAAEAPPAGAHIAPIGVGLDQSGISLTPNRELLDSPDTTYPVYLDPTWVNGHGDLTGPSRRSRTPAGGRPTPTATPPSATRAGNRNTRAVTAATTSSTSAT